MNKSNTNKQTPHSHTRWHAVMVAAGIMLSRIAGLIRESAIAYFFGNSGVADALKAAFRIPNLLQNLFGEGVLSASFIPVYANLVSRGKKAEAHEVAGAVAALLVLVTSLLVLLGVFFTPWIIDIITPGFEGERRELCIVLVRILFPGAGLLVWSAWCLGILNSHGKFFLSYVAPVAWNAAIILTLLIFGGGTELANLARWVAWGSVAGSGAQILVQLPMVLRILGRIGFRLRRLPEGAGIVVKNFLPVFLSRGVIQISAYIDAVLASFLPLGAVAALTYAQILNTLPISLFGMSISAAELPAMSKALGSESEIAEYLRQRLNTGLRRIAYFIVPSAMAFLALGDIVASAVYQRGRFTADDSVYVWLILSGSAVGLLASTMGRLYSSTYYALKDTRTPLRFSVVRVVLTTVLGYLCALHLPVLLEINARWGTAGLTASAGFSGWLEFLLLRHSLNKRIGQTGISLAYTGKLWLAAGAGAAMAWGVKIMVGDLHPVLRAVPVLGVYGSVFFTVTALMRLPEADFIRRILRIK